MKGNGQGIVVWNESATSLSKAKSVNINSDWTSSDLSLTKRQCFIITQYPPPHRVWSPSRPAGRPCTAWSSPSSLLSMETWTDDWGTTCGIPGPLPAAPETKGNKCNLTPMSTLGLFGLCLHFTGWIKEVWLRLKWFLTGRRNTFFTPFPEGLLM